MAYNLYTKDIKVEDWNVKSKINNNMYSDIIMFLKVAGGGLNMNQ